MHGGAPACPYPNTPTDPNQATLYQDGNNFLKTWVTAIMKLAGMDRELGDLHHLGRGRL